MKELVIEFRKALDKINWSSMPVGFKNFPEGTCGDISDILAEYLYQNGFQDIDYICGESADGSHAWLEIDGKVVDITADQFYGVREKVMIQSPEIWHHKYEVKNRRKAGYRDMNGQAISGLVTVYNEIIRQLNV